jgi:hypothetical protein
MVRFGLSVLALLCLAHATASADDTAGAPPASGLSSPSWPGIAIEYDPASWRPQAVPGSVYTRFTCIAGDCAGEPGVLLQAWRLPEGTDERFCRKYQSTEDGYDKRLEIGDPAQGEVRFTLLQMWSGCRAGDLPIYDACGEIAGHAYRFMTRGYAYGCNFGPQVSADRFVELLRSVKPAPMEVPQ